MNFKLYCMATEVNRFPAESMRDDVTCQKPSHYDNTPIQMYWKFYNQKKKENFQIKILIFFIFLLKTYCGYSLEPPRRGGSNEYP